MKNLSGLYLILRSAQGATLEVLQVQIGQSLHGEGGAVSPPQPTRASESIVVSPVGSA
jgi:hypothetical protein